MNEAFVDFTGGVGEVIYLRHNTPGLFSVLRQALAKESLVGATALVSAPGLGGHPHRGSPVPASGLPPTSLCCCHREPIFLSVCLCPSGVQLE